MWLVSFLKFPLWLLKLFIKKPRKKVSERERKQRAYVRNFSIRRYSWQKSLGKKKKSKGKFSANSQKKNKKTKQ